MTPELKYKLERCGKLLAQSPLADEIKNAVIDTLGKMTEGDIDRLIKMLERETIELTALTNELHKFNAAQDVNWSNLENSQAKTADEMVEKALQGVS